MGKCSHSSLHCNAKWGEKSCYAANKDCIGQSSQQRCLVSTALNTWVSRMIQGNIWWKQTRWFRAILRGTERTVRVVCALRKELEVTQGRFSENVRQDELFSWGQLVQHRVCTGSRGAQLRCSSTKGNKSESLGQLKWTKVSRACWSPAADRTVFLPHSPAPTNLPC